MTTGRMFAGMEGGSSCVVMMYEVGVGDIDSDVDVAIRPRWERWMPHLHGRLRVSQSHFRNIHSTRMMAEESAQLRSGCIKEARER